MRTGSWMGPPQGKWALRAVLHSSHVNELSQIGSSAMAAMTFTVVIGLCERVLGKIYSTKSLEEVPVTGRVCVLLKQNRHG